MLEGFVLGIIQGVTEWLPVSSEGVLTLVGMKFFDKDLSSSVSMAVFLHMGTFLAALVYFRKDVRALFGKEKEQRKVLKFLILSTLVTGVVGVPLLFWGVNYFTEFSIGFLVGLIGLFLVITGLVQFKKNDGAFRRAGDLKTSDAFFLGGLQGMASLPGFSRSGLTIAGLLFRKFQDTEALRLSFLMSLSAVLCANIFFKLAGSGVNFGIISITALATAAITAFFMIHLLLKISRKINFGWFAISFGCLIVLGALLV